MRLDLFRSLWGWQGDWATCAAEVRRMGAVGVEARLPGDPFAQRALRQSLGYRLQLPFLDVAELAPMLNPDTVLREAGLDDWVARFGLQVEERHHASADAQVTAELALILFSQARRQQLDSPLQLEQRLRGWRRSI